MRWRFKSKTQTIKFLGEGRDSSLFGISLSSVLSDKRDKCKNKWDCIRLKVCPMEETLNKMEKLPTEWEK